MSNLEISSSQSLDSFIEDTITDSLIELITMENPVEFNHILTDDSTISSNIVVNLTTDFTNVVSIN